MEAGENEGERERKKSWKLFLHEQSSRCPTATDLDKRRWQIVIWEKYVRISACLFGFFFCFVSTSVSLHALIIAVISVTTEINVIRFPTFSSSFEFHCLTATNTRLCQQGWARTSWPSMIYAVTDTTYTLFNGNKTGFSFLSLSGQNGARKREQRKKRTENTRKMCHLVWMASV